MPFRSRQNCGFCFTCVGFGPALRHACSHRPNCCAYGWPDFLADARDLRFARRNWFVSRLVEVVYYLSGTLFMLSETTGIVAFRNVRLDDARSPVERASMHER